ncbi:MAG: LysM peptidoglycan-binding domain-containing protein [Gammaproteobacteria bacterium]|nr:LysM peptidoglycan-binding domain-containing protein [Gammaproteobacteria bacterium]MDH5594288.1 LysM peptidoglycan-binding domain-containing protein [Gammaproteobacteria bacterium]
MSRKYLLVLLIALFSANIMADVVKLKADHPDRYVVVKGDTLWDISARFLENPWKWPEIWHVNTQIKNPHLIYPGDVIALTWKDGKPRLEIQRGRQTIKLSPNVRESRIESAIPTIPVDAIRQFMNSNRIVGKDEIDNAAYILSLASDHLIGGEGIEVFVRNRKKEDATSRYEVLRANKPFIDPVSGEEIGYEALYLGDSEMQAEGDPARFMLTQTRREVLKGDRLLPMKDEAIHHYYTPRSPSNQIEGRIISVVDGVNQVGSYQVVAINKGETDGLNSGNVLAIYQTGEQVRDSMNKNEMVKLPNERAGLLMVFRTYERVSYALVMEAIKPIHVLDTVVNP